MSTFGRVFRVTTYGESHCASVGAIVDGCPPVSTVEQIDRGRLKGVTGLGTHFPRYPSTIEQEKTWPEQPHDSGTFLCSYGRRERVTDRPPYQRDEKDLVQIQSGIEHGVTLGTPIGLLVKNEDQRPKDYTETDLYPRPSHADLTYLLKYGVKASSGGGRASARETIGTFSSIRRVAKRLTKPVTKRTSGSRCYCGEIPQASVWRRDCRFRHFSGQDSSSIHGNHDRTTQRCTQGR